MKVITFKAEDELLQMLDKYANEHGITRSDAIRKAVQLLLGEEVYTKAIDTIARLEKENKQLKEENKKLKRLNNALINVVKITLQMPNTDLEAIIEKIKTGE